jgi:hypothetical protein
VHRTGYTRACDCRPDAGYSTVVVNESVDTVHAEHVLFVTGPQRKRLYEHFAALFSGRDDVEVRIDRRIEERRREGRGPEDGERRRQERRRRPPEWIVPPPDGA